MRHERTQTAFKALWSGNSTKGGNIQTFQIIERKLLVPINMPKIERLMGTFDDFGRPIIFPDPTDERGIRLAVAFGDENVVCAAEILRRLPQRAAGQEMFVSEGSLAMLITRQPSWCSLRMRLR